VNLNDVQFIEGETRFIKKGPKYVVPPMNQGSSLDHLIADLTVGLEKNRWCPRPMSFNHPIQRPIEKIPKDISCAIKLVQKKLKPENLVHQES